MKIDQAAIKRILIINLAFIGDVILSTPVARALQKTYPHAKIDMLVVPAAKEMAKRNPYIHKVFIYDKKGRHKKISEVMKLISELRKEKYNLTVATNFALRGAVVAFLTGATYRVGYDAQHGKWFLTHAARAERTGLRHEADNYLDVLRPLGITTDDTSLCLNIPREDSTFIKENITQSQGKKLVVICPAGSYKRKSWTAEGYAKVIREISKSADCCLIGGKVEEPFLNEINELAGKCAQVYGGTLTLGQVAALIQRADLMISVDTGPLHIAQAVNTPVIGLFGPTDPAIWGPRNKKDIIIYNQVECSPCWGRGPCPEHQCMAKIDRHEVIASARELLK